MVTQAEFFGTQEPVVFDKPLMTGNVAADDFFGGSEAEVYQSENEEEKLNFAQRFSLDIAKRAAVDDEIKKAYDDGEISYAEGLLQVVGKTGFGSVLDFLGEVVISAGRGLSAITPDIIENPLKDGATAAAHFFLNTKVGQEGLETLTKEVSAWNEFKSKNPRAAMNIEATTNIALLLAPTKTPTPKPKPTFVGKAGQVLEQKATEQVAQTRKAFITDLVQPKQTAAVRTEQIGRTTEKGFLRAKVIEPSRAERAIASEVSRVSGVSSSKTLQGNHNMIAVEVAKEAENLKTALKEKDVIFPRKEFIKALDDAQARLADNPLLVGDAAKTADRIVDKMRQIHTGKKSTASSLLKARKELDAWIKSQKGPNVFDPKQENAISIAVREIRTTTNDFIDKKAGHVIGVKESLRKQSNLLSAMENIAPKAADEASNVILRAWRNLLSILPLRGEFNQTMAAIFGLGGLGASAVFAPFFTKIVLGTISSYVIGKAVMSPQVKRGLAWMLKEMDKALITMRDQSLIAQMRLDRAFIVEMIEMSEVLEEEEAIISGDDDFEKLPSGAKFVGPDGKSRIKP